MSDFQSPSSLMRSPETPRPKQKVAPPLLKLWPEDLVHSSPHCCTSYLNRPMNLPWVSGPQLLRSRPMNMGESWGGLGVRATHTGHNGLPGMGSRGTQWQRCLYSIALEWPTRTHSTPCFTGKSPTFRLALGLRAPAFPTVTLSFLNRPKKATNTKGPPLHSI